MALLGCSYRRRTLSGSNRRACAATAAAWQAVGLHTASVLLERFQPLPELHDLPDFVRLLRSAFAAQVALMLF